MQAPTASVGHEGLVFHVVADHGSASPSFTLDRYRSTSSGAGSIDRGAGRPAAVCADHRMPAAVRTQTTGSDGGTRRAARSFGRHATGSADDGSLGRDRATAVSGEAGRPAECAGLNQAGRSIRSSYSSSAACQRRRSFREQSLTLCSVTSIPVRR